MAVTQAAQKGLLNNVFCGFPIAYKAKDKVVKGDAIALELEWIGSLGLLLLFEALRGRSVSQ